MARRWKNKISFQDIVWVDQDDFDGDSAEIEVSGEVEVEELLKEVSTDELLEQLNNREYFKNDDNFKRFLCDLLGLGYHDNTINELLDMLKRQ